MKKLITLCIFWKLITEKDLKGIQLYFLPFLAIFYILTTITGDLFFIIVRLQHLDGKFIQRNIAPVALFLDFAVTILFLYIYDRNTDIDLLRKKISSMNSSDTKRIKIIAIVTCSVIAFLPLISLSIFSILSKLRII